jgi:hypothetical protein
MNHVSREPAHTAYILLKIVFVVIPIIAGIDKFFNLLTNWSQYSFLAFGKFDAAVLMAIGVIEVIAGVGVYFKPKIFANIVGIWLALIIVNLLLIGQFFDIAARDLGLCLSAFALGRLAKVYS